MIRDPTLFILVPLGVLAFVLGFWGFSLQQPWWGRAEGWAIAFGHVFRTLDLVRAGGGFAPNVQLPLPLELARITLPLCALLIAFRATLLGLRRDARTALLRRARNHVVVTGPDGQARQAALRLAAGPHRVVLLEPGVPEPEALALERAGVLTLGLDPRADESLAQAGIARAAHLVALSDDEATNVEVALKARRLREAAPRHGVLTVTAGVGGGPLYRRLQADPMLHLSGPGARLRLLDPRAAGLRALFRQPSVQAALARPGSARNLLAVVGLGETGLAAAATLARYNVAPPGLGSRIIGFDRDASCAVPLQTIGAASEAETLFRPVAIGAPAALDEAAQAVLREGVPVLVVVALAEDDLALAAALDLRRALDMAGHAAPVAVQLRRAAALGDLLAAECPGGLLPFGQDDVLFAPETFLPDALDDAAEAMHAAYLRGGPSGPAAVPWDALPEWYRLGSRDAADFLPIALASEGFALRRRCLGAPPGSLPPASALERMAELDHRRWLALHRQRGWEAGPQRNVAARRHESLLPWDALPPPLQARGAAEMRNHLQHLLQAGWALHDAAEDARSSLPRAHGPA